MLCDWNQINYHQWKRGAENLSSLHWFVYCTILIVDPYEYEIFYQLQTMQCNYLLSLGIHLHPEASAECISVQKKKNNQVRFILILVLTIISNNKRCKPVCWPNVINSFNTRMAHDVSNYECITCRMSPIAILVHYP